MTMKKHQEQNQNPEPDPATSAEVFELLDAFLSRYTPTDDISQSTKQYTTKEIILALKEFNSDMVIKETDVVGYLKKRGFNYQVLPDNFALKFHWLFVER